MIRTICAFVVGIGIGSIGLAMVHDEGEKVRVIDQPNIVEKLDGKATKASFVEVTIEPGQAGDAHRHPGPGFGYILEGEYEWAIDQQPVKVLKAGDTFYEPTGCLHRVSRNASKQHRARLLAVVLHPQDTDEIAIPEPRK
ncbi:cupin domain-containing protein [Singulisphaera sp. PoT]|uniref:cupin domain-containing protein n=1 Tax=Singulisphaera sp. PoT TaxID=3411797 RepID=UPI003BF54F40